MSDLVETKARFSHVVAQTIETCNYMQWNVLSQSKLSLAPVIAFYLQSCADPEGGTGGPDPPWNLKNLPKKGNFGIFWGLDPPSSVTKNYHFRWTPSHENFWIRACTVVQK